MKHEEKVMNIISKIFENEGLLQNQAVNILMSLVISPYNEAIYKGIITKKEAHAEWDELMKFYKSKIK